MTHTPVPVVCLAGPTGAGKTALALELARQLDAARVQRCRSYRTIGICAGFAIAVILL